MPLFSRDSQAGANEIRRALEAIESSTVHFKWPIIGATFLFISIILLILFSSGSSRTSWRTAKAEKSNLTVAVTATGTLEPVTQVQVGTEITGIVQEVLVDDNDRVIRGQVLARLNTDKLRAEHSQALSSVGSAEAALLESQATLTEVRENLKKLEELHTLSKGLTPSRQELQTARAAQTRASAKVNSSRALIKEARAKLAVTEIYLRKAVVRSPINGIVLERKIEPGQTVTASFATPELFIIAENLTQLILTAAVDEADIGRVRNGQKATFTVDAFPDRTFEANIIRVRYAPSSSKTSSASAESVVTYETTLKVNNSDLSLRPGMTATAEIIVERINDVLVVPNSALRFEPPADAPKKSFVESLIPTPRRRPAQSVNRKGEKRVWVLKNKKPLAVPVKTGPTDGRNTVILGGEVKPGTDVIIEMIKEQN